MSQEEDKLGKQRQQGVGAKHALENEALSKAFEDVEKELARIMIEARSDQADLMMEAKNQITALRDVRQKLQIALENGKYAETQLIQKHKGSAIQRFFS